MLEFFLVWVIDFFFNVVNINVLLLFSLVSIVIFDHHDTFSFIVPGSVWILVDDSIFAADEERLGKNAINHQDKAFYCEKSRVVLLFEIVKIMKFFNVFLEFHFQVIDILFFFIEVFIVDIFFELNIFELFIYFLLFFNFFSRFVAFSSHQIRRRFFFHQSFLTFFFLLYVRLDTLGLV